MYGEEMVRPLRTKREARGEKREERIPEGATKMVASSNHYTFNKNCGHLDGRGNALGKLLI